MHQDYFMPWLRGILSQIVESCWGLYGEKDGDNTLYYVCDSSDTQGEVRFHKPIIEQAVHIDIDMIQLYIYLSFKHIKMHKLSFGIYIKYAGIPKCRDFVIRTLFDISQ